MTHDGSPPVVPALSDQDIVDDARHDRLLRRRSHVALTTSILFAAPTVVFAVALLFKVAGAFGVDDRGRTRWAHAGALVLPAAFSMAVCVGSFRRYLRIQVALNG